MSSSSNPRLYSQDLSAAMASLEVFLAEDKALAALQKAIATRNRQQLASAVEGCNGLFSPTTPTPTPEVLAMAKELLVQVEAEALVLREQPQQQQQQLEDGNAGEFLRIIELRDFSLKRM
jgi:hypothetical protein